MEAAYYTQWKNGTVKCLLCPHECVIEPGKYGVCRARYHQDGKLIVKTYGEVSGMTMESLEEMSFYFYPEKDINFFSIGSYGCNFVCPYCFNKHISQARIHTESLSIENLLMRINNLKGQNVRGVCYTFNEPGIWFEHVRDYSKAIHDAGYLNAMETNGHLNSDAFKELLTHMDLVNLSYKGFDEEFYIDFCEGDFETVCKNIEILYQSGIYYEISCVIVKDVNDEEKFFRKGMETLKSLAPNARVSIIPVVPSDEENMVPPSLAVLSDLEEVAKEYFDEVKLVLESNNG